MRPRDWIMWMGVIGVVVSGILAPSVQADDCANVIVADGSLNIVTCVGKPATVGLSTMATTEPPRNAECMGTPLSNVYSWVGSYLYPTDQQTTTFSNTWTEAGVYTNPVAATITFSDCEKKLLGSATAVTNVIVTVIKVELEVNNTSSDEDDVVCRYSTSPAGRPKVPCRARVTPIGLGSGNVNVILTSASLRFPNAADTTKSLSLPLSGGWVDYEISGQIESTSMDDVAVLAHLGEVTGGVCGEEDLTVLWVNPIAIRATQDESFSSDNGSAIKPTPAKLGAQKITGDDGFIPTLSYTVELCGGVLPANFSSDVRMKRTCEWYKGIEAPDGSYVATTNPASADPGPDDCRDDKPAPNGRIYDIDTPGLDINSGYGTPGGYKVYLRYNFQQHATFAGARCSNDQAWFARVTASKPGASVSTWAHLTRSGHPNDNAAGLGATGMSKD
jgi:hypothetical protein